MIDVRGKLLVEIGIDMETNTAVLAFYPAWRPDLSPGDMRRVTKEVTRVIDKLAEMPEFSHAKTEIGDRGMVEILIEKPIKEGGLPAGSSGTQDNN